MDPQSVPVCPVAAVVAAFGPERCGGVGAYPYLGVGGDGGDDDVASPCGRIRAVYIPSYHQVAGMPTAVGAGGVRTATPASSDDGIR